MQTLKVYNKLALLHKTPKFTKMEVAYSFNNPICDKWSDSLLTDDVEGSEKNGSIQNL